MTRDRLARGAAGSSYYCRQCPTWQYMGGIRRTTRAPVVLSYWAQTDCGRCPVARGGERARPWEDRKWIGRNSYAKESKDIDIDKQPSRTVIRCLLHACASNERSSAMLDGG